MDRSAESRAVLIAKWRLVCPLGDPRPKRTTAGFIELLLSAQTASGAIPASTVHDVYQYGWPRNGSWCAYALQRAGQTKAAARWHHWVAATLLPHRHRFVEAMDAVRNGSVIGRSMLPARFTLDGREEPQGESEEEWPNFQTDCYGFWLWALADHLTRGGELDDVLREAYELVVGYLLVAGDTPCFGLLGRTSRQRAYLQSRCSRCRSP
ncbi:glycoside hydrolase family 15 protein [Arthrobacter sp. MPF02]|uniref:glycoside hydrolase family 15 protein n=1 Tax=Arthrobacter sp. MPF02 TaxID=3388492 RepID=UPI003984E47A